MADVSRDRGQLLVVGAIALAVSLVAVGLVLNFAIYTENLATREGNSGAASVVHEQQAAVEGVGRAMEYVNSHNGSHGATGDQLNASFDEQVALLNDSLSETGAISGAYVQVVDVTPNPGAMLVDANKTRDYLDSGGDADWRVVDGSNVSRFTMRVKRPQLGENTVPLGNLYHLNVTDDQGKTWRTYIYRDSVTGAAYLTTAEPGENYDLVTNALFTCAAYRDNVTVDFLAGKFGGSKCDQLSYFSQTAEPPYTVEFVNGDMAGGTYEILLDDPSGYDDSNFNDVGAGSPYDQRAIFSAEATFRYVGNDIRYEDTKTVSPVPNVTKFPGISPEVLQFDATDDADTGSDGGSFDATWEVRDADADLKSVNVTLVDVNNSEVDDWKEYTTSSAELSPRSGGGTVTLTESESLDNSDTFAVRVVVIDENGNVVTRTVNKNDL